MQKYKVLKGGLTVKAVNPYLPVNGESWSNFDLANPILPLTDQQDEGIEISGELVWQYKMPSGDLNKDAYVKGFQSWYDEMKGIADFETRIALQPIPTNSNPTLEQMVAHTMGRMPALDGLDENSKEEKPFPETVEQVTEWEERNKTIGNPDINFNIDEEWSHLQARMKKEPSPLPIASASIETVEQAAEKYVTNFLGPVDPTWAIQKLEWYEKTKQGYIECIEFGAHWQFKTTQQPLIELLEKVLNSSYVTIRNDDLKQEIKNIIKK